MSDTHMLRLLDPWLFGRQPQLPFSRNGRGCYIIIGSCSRAFTANVAKTHLACGTASLPFGRALVGRSSQLTSLMLPYLKIVFLVDPRCCLLCSVMHAHGNTVLCTMVWL